MVEERRTAVVTGSASGLGRALCLRLARERRRIALVDVDEGANRETLRLVEAAGGEGRIETFDVASAPAWREFHDRLRADWPHVDLLVNNAGVAGSGDVGVFTLDDWHWLLATDLHSVVYGCHTFGEWLKANPRGAHVVNVASFAAFACLPGMAAYNVAKAGVLALSETLRIEWSRTSVGVSVVCPEFFATNLLSAARMGTDAQRDYAAREMERSRISADAVAAATLQAVARRRFYVVEGGHARRIWRFKRWLPNAFLRMVELRYHEPKRSAQPKSL